MIEANLRSLVVGVPGGVLSMLGKGPDWWLAEAEAEADDGVEFGGVGIDDVDGINLELLLPPSEASLSTPPRLLA